MSLSKSEKKKKRKEITKALVDFGFTETDVARLMDALGRAGYTIMKPPEKVHRQFSFMPKWLM